MENNNFGTIFFVQLPINSNDELLVCYNDPASYRIIPDSVRLDTAYLCATMTLPATGSFLTV